MKIVITEEQYEFLKEYSIAENNWEKLSDDDKLFVLEFCSIINRKRIPLNEAEWYNILGDILGIFDPTGLIDLVNGISYIKQGDELFGFLSIVSAVPYVGDVVAKPLIGLLKVNKPTASALKSVLRTAKSGNVTKAADDLDNLTKIDGLAQKIVDSISRIAPFIRNLVDRIPDGVIKGGGIKKTILQWLDLFEGGIKRQYAVRSAGASLAKTFKVLSKAEQVERLELLIKLSKETKGVFSGYRTTKGFLTPKTIFGGLPQLMGRNKSVRALVRQSKWWLGFLDFVGIGDWVDPDEAESILGGKDALLKEMEKYNMTSTAEEYFSDEFGGELYNIDPDKKGGGFFNMPDGISLIKRLVDKLIF